MLICKLFAAMAFSSQLYINNILSCIYEALHIHRELVHFHICIKKLNVRVIAKNFKLKQAFAATKHYDAYSEA